VPCAGASAHLAPGRTIDVDAKQDYVTKFTLLADTTSPLMTAEPSGGDYFVRGPVIFSYDTGDFGVEVGGFIFTLHQDDVLGQRPPIDQWVSFELHGLSLWDRSG